MFFLLFASRELSAKWSLCNCSDTFIKDWILIALTTLWFAFRHVLDMFFVLFLFFSLNSNSLAEACSVSFCFHHHVRLEKTAECLIRAVRIIVTPPRKIQHWTGKGGGRGEDGGLLCVKQRSCTDSSGGSRPVCAVSVCPRDHHHCAPDVTYLWTHDRYSAKLATKGAWHRSTLYGNT